jgi:uncharacterized membrane protein YhaH (DUF805 family)
MTYISAILENIKYSFRLKGRSGLQEYWRYGTLLIILTFMLNYAYASLVELHPESLANYAKVHALILNLISIPMIGLSVRRMHDVNKSAWWYLIALTGVGLLLLFYWSVKGSDKTSNNYGDPPLDIGEGTFYRNIGLTLSAIWLAIIVLGLYGMFSDLSSWTVESHVENNVESTEISRLFISKKLKGAFYKVSFVCPKGEAPEVFISTTFAATDKSPLVILGMKSPPRILKTNPKEPKEGQLINDFNFYKIDGVENLAGVQLSKENMMEFAGAKATIIIDTDQGEINDPLVIEGTDVTNFLRSCK